MIYYIRVMEMASRYKFSEEEIREIEQARKDNKDKRAEARLKGTSKNSAQNLPFPPNF